LRVWVELKGPLAFLAGGERFPLDLEEGADVLTAIRALCEERPELSSAIFDAETGDPRTNFLILLDGRDVDVLSGLATRLGEGQVLTLVPLIRL